jgi:hypothetical protein
LSQSNKAGTDATNSPTHMHLQNGMQTISDT